MGSIADWSPRRRITVIVLSVVFAILIICAIVIPLALLVGRENAYHGTVSVEPRMIQYAEIVNISWTGVPNPSKDDQLIVRPADPTGVTNLLFAINVTHTSGWETGSGVASLRLLNMRRDYIVEYVAASGQPVRSETILVDPTYPMQGHLARMTNPDEMSLMWVSNITSGPMVQWGYNASSLQFSSRANTTTYSLEDLCANTQGGDASKTWFWHPGYIHTAIMKNLPSNTTIFYRFGDTLASWSEVQSFITADYSATEINLIAVGDMGVSNCGDPSSWCSPLANGTMEEMLSLVANERIEMILHIGDISYAAGHATMWDLFFDFISPIASKIPYMVSPGNHEANYIGQPFRPSWSNYGYDSHGECNVPYEHRFHMPENGNGDSWWSVNQGPAHIVMLSTEHDFTMGSVQWNWFKSDLELVDRTRTPWIIVTGHRPMYLGMLETNLNTIMSHHIREHLEPLFDEYKVDVGLWGHIHSYERTCPVLNYTCIGDYDQPGGPVHFLIGMGGAPAHTTWADPIPVWSSYHADEHGLTHIRITPDLFELKFLASYNGVGETVRIRKPNPNV